MIGDTAIGHVDAHNELRDGILREATRFGVEVKIGGPFEVGAPAHISEHNKLVTALRLLADTAGVTVDLPPAHKLGDTGHVVDHDKLSAALHEITISDAWNDASGGTITDVAIGSKAYRVHTFTNPSEKLVVTRAIRPFRVLVAGGGGGSGYNNSSATVGGGGAGGLYTNDAYVLETGEYPITVGQGGKGGYQTYGAGGPSTFDSITMLGGGAGVENGGAGSGASGGGGGGNNDSDGSGGAGTPGQGFAGGSGKYGGPGGGGGAGGPGATGTDRYDPDGCKKGLGGPGLPSNIRGTEEIFCAGGRASVGSVYGGGAFGGCGGSWGNGQPGVVVVSYEIAPVNSASGGTITEYDLDGKRYRLHRFESSSTFSIARAVRPFDVLVVAGGGGGGHGSAYYSHGGQGGNAQAVAISTTLTAGPIPVTVGGSDQPSSLGSIKAEQGGHAGDAYNDGGTFRDGSPGSRHGYITSDITGTSTQYPAADGAGGDAAQAGFPGNVPGGGGGGGGGDTNDLRPSQPGGPGGAGLVLIRYEIGKA